MLYNMKNWNNIKIWLRESDLFYCHSPRMLKVSLHIGMLNSNIMWFKYQEKEDTVGCLDWILI